MISVIENTITRIRTIEETDTPYFMKGSWDEITRKLDEKSQDNTELRYQRFPLIVLIIPVTYTEDFKANTGILDADPFDIYYFVETRGDKDTDWRYTENYQTLKDLSDLFNREFQKVVTNEMEITRSFNPHLEGREYIFNTPVDAWVDSYSGLQLREICENL
jgi:hypothetical protein